MKSFVDFSENLEDKKQQLMQKQKVMQQMERERASRSNQEFQQDREEKQSMIDQEKEEKKKLEQLKKEIKREIQQELEDEEEMDEEFGKMTKKQAQAYTGMDDKEEKSPLAALQYIDNVRKKLLDPEDAGVEAAQNGQKANMVHATLYGLYEKYLTENKLIDFERMIQWSCKVLEADASSNQDFISQFTHILIDEYQDINPIQQQWIHFLYKGNKNICCVGDDDQSIYSWRGADVTNLLNFEKNFENVTIVRLEQNYRSTRNILSCASTLIAKNKGRYGKELWSKNQIGEKITINGFWETKEESIFVTDKIENIIKDKNIFV